MMGNKVHIFFPKDSSTDFLNSIIEYLTDKVDDEKIIIYRLTKREEHSDFFNYIYKIPKNELIVFLGHGTSVALAGASTSEYENPTWISHKQLMAFEDLRVVLMSCRSNEYLKNYAKDCKLKAGIGFPFLLTDIDEINESDNIEQFSGEINERDIELFRKTISNVIEKSIEDYLISELNFHSLYKRIELRLNKELLTINKSKFGKESLHSQMIRDMRDSMYIMGF